jgi:saccharopine dehydrogenase-like NADP-dependent oxidoreductase
MASYLILGAGKFGRLSLRRLAAQDPGARFLVIDRQESALAKARTPEMARVEMRVDEAISYLAAHLGPEPFWDWLIPIVPVHVA